MPKRGAYDRATVDSILDEALICHLALTGREYPIALPTLHARVDDHVYLHGSAASRTLRELSGGIEVCLTATLVDGLVLARSAFHHSVNYRSVMLFGRAEPVNGPEEKERALATFMEKLVPGRWPDVRRPSGKELKATAVLRLPIAEGSAKVRTGPPLEEEDDYALDVWAGVVPFAVQRLAPQPDPRLPEGTDLPDYLRSRS